MAWFLVFAVLPEEGELRGLTAFGPLFSGLVSGPPPPVPFSGWLAGTSGTQTSLFTRKRADKLYALLDAVSLRVSGVPMCT